MEGVREGQIEGGCERVREGDSVKRLQATRVLPANSLS